MILSFGVFFSQSDMRIINSSDFLDLRSLSLSQVLKINYASRNFKLKLRELTLISLELVKTIIVNHASDVSIVFEIFFLTRTPILPDTAKVLHVL